MDWSSSYIGSSEKALFAAIWTCILQEMFVGCHPNNSLPKSVVGCAWILLPNHEWVKIRLRGQRAIDCSLPFQRQKKSQENQCHQCHVGLKSSLKGLTDHNKRNKTLAGHWSAWW